MINDYGSFGMYFMGNGYGPLSMLAFAILLVIPFYQISKKAGYSGWLALLILVPLINLFYLYYLAFSEWDSPRDTAQSAH